MNQHEKNEVRHAVRLAVKLWPNAHLGAVSEAEDRRSAFQMIRNRLGRGWTVLQAAGEVMHDAYRHADM